MSNLTLAALFVGCTPGEPGQGVARFGTPVGIDNSTVLVGAEVEDDAGNRSGVLYVYERGDEVRNWAITSPL